MGFFTRDDMRKSTRGRALPVDVARQLGPSAAASMNRKAETPNMRPEIPVGGCDVLVIDAWPTPGDDSAGKPFGDDLGLRYRRRAKRVAGARGVGFDYICRTLPPGGREPTPVQIAAFQRDVEKTIAKAKPRAVIACGHRVVDWFSPGIGYNITTHRGRRFPAEVNGHTFWVYPVIGRYNWSLCEKGDDASSGEEYKKQTWRDIDAVGEKIDPPAAILPADKRALLRPYSTNLDATVEDLVRFAKRARNTVSIDIETHGGKRPYNKGARIISVAVCDGRDLLAMAVDHPEVPRSRAQVRSIFAALLEVFTGRRMVAHNATFELEWFQYFTAAWAAGVAQSWECTQIGAFSLDSRPGKSLDYLCRLYFALPLKQVSPAKLWDEKGAVPALLEYNALDAALGWEVDRAQVAELEGQSLTDAYDFHMERVVPLVDMQARGLPIDQEEVREFEIQYRERLVQVHDQLRDCHEVLQFEDTYGSFNPSSTEDVAKLYGDAPECLRDGKATVDAEALGKLERFPSATLILEYRDAHKKLGTYVQRYLPESKNTYLSLDGLVHCEYASDKAQTRRLACSNPNNQNWPKRRGKEIRRIVKPPSGYTLVSIDLGQIEARVLAMLTLDRQVIRMFVEDYDVHLEWAERLADLDPGVMARRGMENMKAWRAQVKNQFVFPSFYGAGKRKISRLTQIPEHLIEEALDKFWKQFAAVRKWQKDQLAFYERHHYVVSPTGYRRRAPLKYNMVINTPIQSVASDICVQGLVNANRIAYETACPWWTPIMNIHDDLTWAVPDEHVNAFIPQAVRAMIDLKDDPRYDFINIPLTCEVEVGKDWASMEDVGTFRSDRL